MRIVHIVPVTPHKCGMYETTRELVEAECKLGIDSRLFDPRPTPEELLEQVVQASNNNQTITIKPTLFKVPDDFEDRGAKTCSLEFFNTADIIVSHSGIRDDMLGGTIPIIHVAHGRPYSSFLLEHTKQSPIYTQYNEWNNNPRFKAFVTLWPGYEQYLELVISPEKLYAFDPFVNTDRWQPKKHDNFDWHGNAGEINIVCTDIWRLDKDPYYVINAFAQYYKKYPNAKLHLFACQPSKTSSQDGQFKIDGAWGRLFKCMNEKGMIGEIMVSIDNIEIVYQNADVLITPHIIATRTIREALSCGCQVVAGLQNPYTPYTAYVEDLNAFASEIDRAVKDKQNNPEAVQKRNRQIALDNFSTERTAKQFLQLYGETLSESNKRSENRSPTTGLCAANC